MKGGHTMSAIKSMTMKANEIVLLALVCPKYA